MRTTITIISTLAVKIFAHTCQDICEGASSCSKGSYCKSWQSIPVCYGLYYVEPELLTVCYFPDDPLCPEQYPVECPTDHPESVALNTNVDAGNVTAEITSLNQTISLAKMEPNSTIESTIPMNNRTSNIQVFDWVADVPIVANDSLPTKL